MTRSSAWWAYPAAAALSLLLVAFALDLWRADLRIPLTYDEESLFNGLLVKHVLQHGWRLFDPALSAPTGLDVRDLFVTDNAWHFATIRLLGLFASDPVVVMNLFFVLTFPLTAMTALLALRQLGVAVAPALCGSLLYALAPFHFARGQYHLFLAAYYLVPLAVMVTWWIGAGAASAGGGPSERRRNRRRLVASVIVCVLVASSGVYYAFFACFLFLVAGVVAAVRRRRVRELAAAMGLVAIVFAVVTTLFWPSLVHVREQGATPLIIRTPADTERYGLRIWQLLMPVTGHRVAAVARFKDAVNATMLGNEAGMASLGVIGSIGFLALLAGLVLDGPATTEPTGEAGGPLRDLRILNLSAVLLATVGGFGTIVALTVLSNVRAYNRISIYIAFFSIAAVVVALDAFARRHARTPGRRALFLGALAALVVLGVLDQTPRRGIEERARIAAEYESDRAFVRRLEAVLPPGAQVFQLPVTGFPEHPTVHRMLDYDHARGYLHARHLRWSYGAVRGRADELWQRRVAATPTPELVDALSVAGFSGLYLNRDGYPDGAARLTEEIARVAGGPPVVSDDGRLVFFDLGAHRARLRAASSADAWGLSEERVRYPVLVSWHEGCAELEGTPPHEFRWCGPAGVWRFINGAPRDQRVSVTMTFASPHPGDLRLDGPLLREQLRTDPAGRSLAKTITVPPGTHPVRFRSDAPRLSARGDGRALVFRVVHFTARSAEP